MYISVRENRGRALAKPMTKWKTLVMKIEFAKQKEKCGKGLRHFKTL